MASPVDFPTNPLSSSPCGAEFVTAFDPSIRIDDKTWTSSNASSTSTSPDKAERIRNMATPDLNKAGDFYHGNFCLGKITQSNAAGKSSIMEVDYSNPP